MSQQISILVGGRSTEHDASVHSYLGVLHDLERRAGHGLELRCVYYVTRTGRVLVHESNTPRPTSLRELEAGVPLSFSAFVGRLIDEKECFVFSLLHGNEGEDGAWQGLAEVLDLRGFFGPVFASSVSMNKWAMSVLARDICPGDLTYPPTWRVRPETPLQEIVRVMREIGDRRFIIKPNRMGASHFTEAYARMDAREMRARISEIAAYDPEVLIQLYVEGEEYTCGCVCDGREVTALPVIRVSTERKFLGHAEKHTGGLAHVEMFKEDTETTARIKLVSRELFAATGFAAMCRFDYILSPGGELYFLEANSIPGLMLHSAFPMMLRAAGLDLVDLVRISIEDFSRTPRREKFLPYSVDRDAGELSAASITSSVEH